MSVCFVLRSNFVTPVVINLLSFLNFYFVEDSGGCLEAENHRREIMLFEALTQFMKNSALHSMEEIVG